MDEVFMMIPGGLSKLSKTVRAALSVKDCEDGQQDKRIL
jgi:hypothetical protein